MVWGCRRRDVSRHNTKRMFPFIMQGFLGRLCASASFLFDAQVRIGRFLVPWPTVERFDNDQPALSFDALAPSLRDQGNRLRPRRLAFYIHPSIWSHHDINFGYQASHMNKVWQLLCWKEVSEHFLSTSRRFFAKKMRGVRFDHVGISCA